MNPGAHCSLIRHAIEADVAFGGVGGDLVIVDGEEEVVERALAKLRGLQAPRRQIPDEL